MNKLKHILFCLMTLGILFAEAGPLHALQGVGNIDAFFDVERVTVTYDGKLFAWNKLGQVLQGFPVDLSAEQKVFVHRPRLMDVNEDAREDIIALAADGAGSLELRVYQGNGTEIPNWRFTLPLNRTQLLATPIIADVNADNLQELIFSSNEGEVFVFNRQFQRLAFAESDIPGTPFGIAADPENDGQLHLFVASADKIYAWNNQGQRRDYFTLPNGEAIIGEMNLVDFNQDQKQDFVFSTTNHRIVFVGNNGEQLGAIAASPEKQFSGPAVVGDVDADGETEVLVATNLRELLAFNLNGVAVGHWDEKITYRTDLNPSVGRVVNDQYAGSFSSALGYDQQTVYRSNLQDYAHLYLGENVHEYDSQVPLYLLEGPFINNVQVQPQLITPNGDRVNDEATISYNLSKDAEVSIQVIDSHGRPLYYLIRNESKGRGNNQDLWNGMNGKDTLTRNDDTPLEKGNYTLRIIARDEAGVVSTYDTFGIVFGVRAVIELPADNNRSDNVYPLVQGQINLSGMATDPNIGEAGNNHDFNSYKLYWKAGAINVTEAMAATAGNGNSGWVPIPVPLQHQSPNNQNNEPNDSVYPSSNVSVRTIQHGLLGTWDTTDVIETPNGLYTVLLKVLDGGGNREGQFNYDSLVVNLANPNALDPNQNGNGGPAGAGAASPQFSNVSVAPLRIDPNNSQVSVSYTLTNPPDKSSDINATLYEFFAGQAGRVVYTENFRRKPTGNYNFTWNGTDTLGRRVSNGLYRVRLTATIVNGVGSATNEDIRVTVDRLSAENEPLELSLFDVSPNLLDPFNFDANGLLPEALLPQVYYLLNKSASVSIAIYDGDPGNGGQLKKQLLQDYVGATSPARLTWDGTDSNGLVLPTNQDYYVQLVARSRAFRDDEEIISEPIVLRLARNNRNAAISADIDHMVGDNVMNDGILVDDGEEKPLEGNPNFNWRMYGSNGYVKVPFEYTLGAFGTDHFGSLETDERSTDFPDSSPGPVLHPSFLSNIIRFPCSNDTQNCDRQYNADLDESRSSMVLSFPEGWTITEYSASFGISWFAVTGQMRGTNRFQVLSNKNFFTGAMDISGPNNQNIRSITVEEMEPRQDYRYPLQNGSNILNFSLWTLPTGQAPDGRYLNAASIWAWGQLDTRSTRDWNSNIDHSACVAGPEGIANCANTYQLNYDGPVGSGLDGLVSRDLNYYTLSLRANINGGLLANQVNGGVHTLPGLQAWMGDENGPHNHPNGYSSSNFVARSDAGGNWHTGRDPVLSGAGGWIVGNSATSFNRNNFHLESDIINIRDYYPLNDPNAQNLYTFSNLVHITQWNTEFRYPNGDEVTAFERGTMNIFSDGTLNIRGDNLEDVNSNYNDNFTFRMTPDGIPRRFLEIRGSAQANYSLRYYDASRLEWIAIPSATQNEVVNGILAWWDVTYLNGRNITVLLRSEQNGEINEDTIDVSIGRPVAPGQRVEVSTPFERATLDFDPNTLPAGTNEQLVTMSLVDPSDPSIHLPSGAVPLGPILDIKPDDIEIDPNHPVELTLRFTCEEINELFGNDPAEVSLYNIRDNGELEVIASLNAPDPTICENAPADRLFEIVGFLNHFSRYAVFKRGTTPSVIHLETPVEDQFYKGSVPVSGSIEGDRLSSWRVSYTPAVDEDDALPANPTIINQGNTQDFNFQWNTEGLNGSFTLLVEAIDNNGQTSTYQRVVKIDNIAPLTIPFLNELELINGERALADLNDVLELSAIDSGDEASGVQSLVYQVNGGAFVNYEGAIALNILGLGNHRISFRATDRIGNEEALKTIVLAVAEEIEPEEPAVIQTQISVGQPSITRNGQIWVSERTPITIQAAQGENSISSILYSFGDGDFRPYNGAFTLAGLPEGIYEIEYYAADFFGNNEPIRRQTVILDNVRPVTTVRTGGVAQNVNGGLLVRSHQTLFTLTGEDLGNHPSGIRYIQYRIGQGIWLRYNNPFRISRPQGANQTSLALRAIDHVGNVESAHVLNILFDANAPQAQVVSLPQAFSPNGDGVKDTAVFTLNADDDLAEELILDLRIGNSFILQNHPVQRGPIEVAWNGRINGQLQRNGEYAYTINVRDAEGNVSNAVGGVVILDVTSPMLQVANAGAIRFIPDRQGRGTINIPYDVSDNLFNKGLQTKLRIFAGNLVLREIVEEISSPPNQHSIAWDGNNSQGLPVPEGDYEWALSATDPAGNESAIVRFPVHVDISSPEIGYEITDPKYITPERVWIHGNSRISLFANDIHSNIQFVHYRVDQLPWQMYQAPFGFNEEGEHILEFGAIDESGNGSGIQRLSINVDLTAPQSRFVMNNFRRGFDNRIQVSSQTRLRLDASDAGSGVLSRRLSIDGSEVLLAGPDIDLVAIADGRHVIEYWSVDNVLNTERRHQVEVDANIHPPRSTLVVNGPQFRGDRFYISRNSQLTIEATATIPDIDYVRYTVDQNAAITVEGDRVDTLRTPIFRIANQGAHLIGHQSADVLGNMENLNKRAVFVDNTPPTTSLEFSNNAFGREGVRRIKDDTKITLRAVDEHVGIKTVFYRIDQGPEQIYDGPFMLNDEDGGNHTINYRSEDQLENIEMIKSEVVFLWHPSLRKEVLRESRSLWHIVECSEDNQEDEHPYRDLLEDIMETKLGDTFYQFADDFEDWNRFMRSDIFNTFIFGMDNPQCEALRSPKLIRILSELKERVFNGDTVILLENPNHIPDWIWRNFIGRVFAQRALPVDPDQQWEVHPYGLGRGIVMDVTDENDGTVDEGRANDLGPLLEGIEDRDEELNSGEIFPVKIWVGSPFDAMAGDLLETSSTQGNFTEVKIHSHDRINQHDGELKWNYTVPSGEGRFLRYLYRVSEQGGPYQVISKINLRSEYGLKYVEQLDLNFEVKHSLQDLSRLVADDFQTLIQEEIDNQRRQQLGLLFNRFNAEMARNVANEADVNLRIDVILFLIDRLRGMDLEDDPIHYDLAELLIVVEATGIPQPEPPGNAFVQRNDDDENERAIQLNNDTDRDGLDDATERAHALDPLDADSDDDGVKDGEEVQPLVDTDNDGAINALDPDSDNDGLVDGTETGIIEPVEAFDGDRVQNLPAFEGTQEDSPSFVPDEDPASRTNPVIADTDGGGVSDGAEDSNHNGRVDPAERNPNDPDDDQRRVIIRVQEMP